MELYILSKQDLSILSICKLADYQINLDEETNAKSTFTLMKTNGLKKENYMVLNGLYRQFIFVIDDVQTEKSSNVVTVTALDISNIFDRKVIEKNIDTMKSKSIEEFLANTISENFVNSDDTALNVNYIEIYWHTNTQGNVATNAENGLYNFHTFLTNCRQYKNIYTDFKLENLGKPQTVEGKRISVEAKNRKIVDISLHGESTQNGTPTPDSPIEIENVEGKNLFDGNYTTGTIDTNGKEQTSSTALRSGYIEVKGNTDYILSSPDNASYIRTLLYDKNKTFIKTVPSSTSFLTTEDTKYFRFVISGTDTSARVQLEYGTVATPYVPYNSLEFKVEGKNRFNGTLKSGLILAADGKTYVTNNNYVCSENFIEIEGSKTYTISNKGKLSGIYYVLEYDANRNFIKSSNSSNSNSFSVTVSSNCKFIRVEIGSSANPPTIETLQDFQIEEGLTATEYEPYKSQIAYFPLGEGEKLMEGSYLADDGIHHKRKQTTVTIQNIVALSNGNVGGIFQFAGKKYSNNNVLFCDKAKYDPNRRFVTDTVYENQVNVVFVGDSTDTLETLKAKYDGAILEYELAEPEIVPYTAEQQEAWNKIKNLTLFEGVNHISSDANMVLKYYPLEPVGLKFILRIDIENKQDTTELIDTTLPEVTDYNKIYEEDVTAKVQVYIREDGSEYNLYLKTDRTTTTNKDDPDRASGKIEVISVDTADKAEEEALNVMKGNNYKHLVEFKIAKTSKLMDITKLHIRKTY